MFQRDANAQRLAGWEKPEMAVASPWLGEASASPGTKLTKCLVIGAADVAELADALDSKSGTRESVWVRPPPSAPPELPGEMMVSTRVSRPIDLRHSMRP